MAKVRNADQRIEALNELGILDTAPDKRFDDIVLLACEVCQCPVALVSFVDEDRQWFKARRGFPSCQTSLDQSVCRFVLNEPDVLVIPDLTNDVRTSQNTLVTSDPEIRFYAGAPIYNNKGIALGSLCVIDTLPRPEGLTAQQKLALKALANQVMLHLETIRQHALHSKAKDAEHAFTATELVDERRIASLREQFVAILGHDLRNPLNAIGGGLQILEHEQLTQRGRALLDMMKQSVGRMDELIENMLDFARTKLSDGIVLDSNVDQPLTPVLEQVIDELQSAWPTRTIKAKIEIEVPVSCDRSRIAQLFSNLLSNALKHGAADKDVSVAAVTKGDFLVLSVCNGGVPISPQTLERLFQPYAQGGERDGRGLGLGLYIAAEIARAHGGSISATSTAEETRFVFQMPVSIDPGYRPASH